MHLRRHNGSEGHGAPVVQTGHLLLLGNGNDGAGFETGGDRADGKGLIENASEYIRQLVCTGLQHTSRDAIWTSRLPWVDPLEGPVDVCPADGEQVGVRDGGGAWRYPRRGCLLPLSWEGVAELVAQWIWGRRRRQPCQRV